MISAFVAGVTAALLVAAGLVYDGGQLLAARRHAHNVAAAAARTGAQELDIDALYAGRGVLLESHRAVASATAASHAHGARTAEVTVAGDHVTVRVEFPDRPVLFGALGIVGPAPVTATATARIASGVEGG